MALPQSDIDCLEQRGLQYAVSEEASMTCVVLIGYGLPSGFSRASADLLLRLSPGFPDVPPDMWWFDPAVGRADGKPIAATEHMETHLGRVWQRWSRHLSPSQWQPGTDSLESFLALVRRELERSCTLELAQ
jgi:Prokaryotic E2 family E